MCSQVKRQGGRFHGEVWIVGAAVIAAMVLVIPMPQLAAQSDCGELAAYRNNGQFQKWQTPYEQVQNFDQALADFRFIRAEIAATTKTGVDLLIGLLSVGGELQARR